MKGHAKVIDALNGGLTIELTAINQYFCQAKMCKNWGYFKLAAKHYEESIGEMKHAEILIDRIRRTQSLLYFAEAVSGYAMGHQPQPVGVGAADAAAGKP